MKVKITARRIGKRPATMHTIIDTETALPDHAIDEAKITFLNDYINRDCEIRRFDNISKAQDFAKLKVTAELVTKD